MKKSIIIIGAGMGGMSSGIYGQLNSFDTTIYEAHKKPGGQCTSWKRKGYVFDPVVHSFNGFKSHTRFNAFWQELGALPCEMVKRNEFVRAVFPDKTYFHNYLNLEKLQQHLKQLSPADTFVIDEYINGIKLFLKEFDWFGISHFGSFWEKFTIIPFILPRLKYFKYTLGTFAERFKHPLLRKAFPFICNSIPQIPLFAYLGEHASAANGDIGWPKGGGFTLSKNMAARYEKLGGTINYSQKAAKILTENNQACGVELEDGTQHKADFVISNADGRKTIMQMLTGKYINKKISRYCEPNPDNDIGGSVTVFLGVKRDLSSYPSALMMFLDKPEVIGGHSCEHLDMQIYGFDSSMAPAGKGVIKVELFTKASYFSQLNNDKTSYQTEKNRIADQVITLLEKQFPGIRDDIEVIDVATLHTWERFMGGTEGHNNYPNKYNELGDLHHVIDIMFGLGKTYTLPGLKNFFLTGQWVTSMGSLALNALSGKTVIQKICKQCNMKFKQSS
jgi:phytoene dehydrogenase-like protein